MIISFKHLISECVYNEKNNFHNRLSKKKLRSVFALTQEKFREWNSKSLDQIKEEYLKNFRRLTNKEKAKRAKDFSEIKNHQGVDKLIMNNELWQLPINEEIRIIGILEEDYVNKLALPKKLQGSNKDLFLVLYYDFEHTSHSNKKKNKDLICIMKEQDCLSH